MQIKISRRDVIWSYFGYILKFSSGIILLPILVTSLSPEHLGIWYVFLSVGAVVQLLDLGFSPTITRNISYAFAGASFLQKEGICESVEDHPNYDLILSLIKVSHKVYLVIATSALALLLLFGSAYIMYITSQMENNEIIIAWIIYSIGIFFNLFFSYWMAVLIGIGKIQEVQKATVISQVCYFIISFLGLSFSFGIIALSCAFLVSGFILRFFCKLYFDKFIFFEKSVIDTKELKKLYKIVWHNAQKFGAVSVGAYMILQSNTIICSIFFDLKTTASYGLTLQVINVLIMMSGVLFRTYLPVMNEARIIKNMEVIKKELSRTIVFSWILYMAGAVIIVFFGEMILQIIRSKTMLLETNMLLMMLLYLFLEFNHSNFATLIMTKNEVPFVKASLLSGIGVVLVSLFNVIYLKMGIWGLLTAQFIVQLSYSNWRWPLYVMKDLNIGLWKIVEMGLEGIVEMCTKRRS